METISTLETFRQAVAVATTQAARAAVVDHGAEKIYSFALYTSEDYAYVCATLSTEVGLATVAERYLAQASYRDRWDTLETVSRALRWSPCDSPYHEAYAEYFEQAGALLEDLWETVDEEDEAYDEDYDAMVQAIHDAMTQALVALRDSRILPVGVVLNLLKGDQSDEERLANSALVNDPAPPRAFEREMQQTTVAP